MIHPTVLGQDKEYTVCLRELLQAKGYIGPYIPCLVIIRLQGTVPSSGSIEKLLMKYSPM